ncbi:GNAT family N-acetyltransferase [uncultured Oscillibacter sp.]|uniref:GNAT family N-acetyltransferase n=1 Tax=uncultured Oscillibacter sp. TaxID=876091 RepID=UPI0025E1B56E|nr:GNAT family N-acetyltransferase [uncultured Oscillibacter sp.]
MNTLELAVMEHAEEYYGIIQMGREFQQEQGFTQWTEDYPTLDTVKGDIREGKGYALLADGRIAGYLCIDLDGEPAYADIDGRWRAEGPYAVVHRMAFSAAFRGMGLADAAFRLIEEFCGEKAVSIIRVDTDLPNKRMQHILTKNGFVNCGTIVFQGGPKLAYDKILG